MKTIQSKARELGQRGASFARLALGTLALGACQASVQGEAHLNTSSEGKEQVRDFDRPLEPAAAAAAEAAPEKPPAEAYALLGARHDLNYAGPKQPSCQCLAVSLNERASDAAFQWEIGMPNLDPSTQQVIAFTSNGVSCDAPPSGTLGASYQGYGVDGNDIVVYVEALGEGRPMTSGAIIPKPLKEGSVFVEPAGAIYGKPLEGKGKRCKITPSGGAASAAIFPGVGGTGAATKPAAKPAPKP